jgi:mannan endo-1,4-beta-mannosidase
MRRARQFLSALIPVGVIGLVVWLIAGGGGTVARPAPLPRESLAQQPPALAAAPWYNGVALAHLAQLPAFITATGEHPQIVQLYIGMTKPFPAGSARKIIRAGALPLIQVNPRHASLAAIAAGRYDSWLRADAKVIAALGRQVAVSFAHEANGDWYSWGCRQQPAADYIAAWRHVHDVIGTAHVTWTWTVNHTWHGAPCGLLSRYPGAGYVDWIGVDGYLRNRVDTYASVFAHTAAVLAPLGKPVLLTEAGVPLGPGAATRIASIYAGARAGGLAGVIYFDSATRKGDYRPQDRPAALAAFRAAVGGTP